MREHILIGNGLFLLTIFFFYSFLYFFLNFFPLRFIASFSRLRQPSSHFQCFRIKSENNAAGKLFWNNDLPINFFFIITINVISFCRYMWVVLADAKIDTDSIPVGRHTISLVILLDLSSLWLISLFKKKKNGTSTEKRGPSKNWCV